MSCSLLITIHLFFSLISYIFTNRKRCMRTVMRQLDNKSTKGGWITSPALPQGLVQNGLHFDMRMNTKERKCQRKNRGAKGSIRYISTHPSSCPIDIVGTAQRSAEAVFRAAIHFGARVPKSRREASRQVKRNLTSSLRDSIFRRADGPLRPVSPSSNPKSTACLSHSFVHLLTRICPSLRTFAGYLLQHFRRSADDLICYLVRQGQDMF